MRIFEALAPFKVTAHCAEGTVGTNDKICSSAQRDAIWTFHDGRPALLIKTNATMIKGELHRWVRCRRAEQQHVERTATETHDRARRVSGIRDERRGAGG